MLQAAIAALHADEPPDWPQIAALYGELARLTGSPVVELNRAVAIAEAGDVEAALAVVDSLELDRYHYLHATRAELLRRLGRDEDCPRRLRPRARARRTRTPSDASSSGAGRSSRAEPPADAHPPRWERSCSAATFWGTTIAQASSTGSRISASSIAASRTTAQL